MKYEQITGKLFDGSKLVGVGWAGHLQGRNDPSMESIKNVGPLPRGLYTIEDPVDNTHLGPMAFPLTPDPKNEMFGRNDFYIHGASVEHPALSSDGCIIQGLVAREFVRIKIGQAPKDSPLRQLEVV
jgi:hypothetical protein